LIYLFFAFIFFYSYFSFAHAPKSRNPRVIISGPLKAGFCNVNIALVVVTDLYCCCWLRTLTSPNTHTHTHRQRLRQTCKHTNKTEAMN